MSGELPGDMSVQRQGDMSGVLQGDMSGHRQVDMSEELQWDMSGINSGKSVLVIWKNLP